MCCSCREDVSAVSHPAVNNPVNVSAGPIWDTQLRPSQLQPLVSMEIVGKRPT